MKKVLTVYLILFMFLSPAYCAMVDDSIDSDIRRNYKTDVIEKDLLLSLPKVEPSLNYDSEDTVFTPNPSEVKTSQPVNYSKPQQQQSAVTKKIESAINNDYAREYKEIKIKKGTRFKLRLQNTIADTTPRGTVVTFVSVYPETQRYITIPAGTVFKGQVVNSHSPQLLGNGGLIQLKVDQIVYKRSAYYVSSKVGIANYKRIYLNNIKGRQTYLKSMTKLTKPGNKFMKKMWGVSDRLSDSGPGVILIPIAIVCGVVVYGFNVLLSPVLSLFSIGDSIRIPSGSYFEIKLTEDAIIRDY